MADDTPPDKTDLSARTVSDKYTLSMADACKILDRSERTISRLVAIKKLSPRTVRVNGTISKYLFCKSDIERCRQDLNYWKVRRRSDQTNLGDKDDLSSNATPDMSGGIVSDKNRFFSEEEDQVSYLKETIRNRDDTIKELQNDLRQSHEKHADDIRSAHTSHAEERAAERAKQENEVSMYRETISALLSQVKQLSAGKHETPVSGEGESEPYKIVTDTPEDA